MLIKKGALNYRAPFSVLFSSWLLKDYKDTRDEQMVGFNEGN